jgi:molybdopterin-guanine dinucleotide biosynthesis protein A
MMSHVADALHEAGLDVLVVGRDEAPGLRAVPDVADLGDGPAIGLLTAFRHLPDGDVFLAAVDQPFLDPRTIRLMLELPGDAVVPLGGSHPQVTCALYRRSCRQPLERLVDSGNLKLRDLLSEVETHFVEEAIWSGWDEDGRSWLSLDTPEAVRDAEALP